MVVRGLFARWVEAEPGIEVVGSLRTGREAVEQIERTIRTWWCSTSKCRSSTGMSALPLLLEQEAVTWWSSWPRR